MRNYSLGMRQRLGIAHALLGDPSVLILDEPANGLDPAGIRWMRGLLKGYSDRGGTVLLSSHLLNEVEQIADEMLLIGRGKIVARGTKAELLAGAGGAGTMVVAEDNDRLTAALNEQGLTYAPVGLGFRVDASRSTSAASRSRGPSCSPTCARSRAASRTSSSSSPPTPSATTSCTHPRPQESPHDHRHRSDDPRRQPDRPGALHPARPGRAAQDVRHPCRPMAAHLRRRLHRPGADHPAVGRARPGHDGRRSTTSPAAPTSR